jgi:hypothetical protein
VKASTDVLPPASSDVPEEDACVGGRNVAGVDADVMELTCYWPATSGASHGFDTVKKTLSVFGLRTAELVLADALQV